MTFHDMGIPQALLNSFEKLGFQTPTPIQAETIPLGLQGKDILGSAQTGTGKTLAFSVPLIANLLENPKANALVLVPTRELAQQVERSIRQLLGDRPTMRTALLIGGESIYKQFQQLRGRPRIVVGTPGRTIDHFERQTLNPDGMSFLVLDEMDRMFDMGFGIQLEDILSRLPEIRQTLMFTATLPKNIEKLAGQYLKDPVRVAVGSGTAPIAKIKQEIIHVSEGQKYGKLLDQLDKREGTVLVFVKTKIGADLLADKLNEQNHSASAIHGDLRQQKRERVINAFRRGRNRIMVATDVAARGLDIPHIMHVINYDLPQAPEDYIHRIGRTGRAGAEGEALCLISPRDAKLWHAIHRMMNPSEKPARDEGRTARPSFPKGQKFGKKPESPFSFRKSESSFSRKPKNNKIGDQKRKSFAKSSSKPMARG